MNKKRKRVLKYSVVAISILFVITFISVRPFSPFPILTLQPIDPDPDPDGSIFLEWSEVDGASWYYVEMSKDGGDWEYIKTTPGFNFTKTGLTNGAYKFKVTAFNIFYFFVALSNTEYVVVSIPIPEPPDEPILNTIVSPNDDGLIHISWNPVFDALYYEVHRSKDGGNYIAVELFIDENYYDDSVFVDGTYSYKVKAKNDIGSSDFSNIETVVVCFSILDPPNEPVLESISPEVSNDGVVSLSWSSVLNALYYEVYRSYDESSFVLLKTLDENYCDDLVLDDGIYSYRIKAVNDIGSSGFSNVEYVVAYITEPTEPIEPTEPTDDYTVLYILLGVLAILIVPVVILVKRKRKSQMSLRTRLKTLF